MQICQDAGVARALRAMTVGMELVHDVILDLLQTRCDLCGRRFEGARAVIYKAISLGKNFTRQDAPSQAALMGSPSLAEEARHGREQVVP